MSLRIQSDTIGTWRRSCCPTRSGIGSAACGVRGPKARITAQIRAAGLGNFGDVRPVGSGVFEMRFPYGPGYRAYYVRRGAVTYLLLIGGDKSTQSRDIQKAKDMAATLDAGE